MANPFPCNVSPPHWAPELDCCPPWASPIDEKEQTPSLLSDLTSPELISHSGFKSSVQVWTAAPTLQHPGGKVKVFVQIILILSSFQWSFWPPEQGNISISARGGPENQDRSWETGTRAGMSCLHTRSVWQEHGHILFSFSHPLIAPENFNATGIPMENEFLCCKASRLSHHFHAGTEKDKSLWKR